MKKVYNICSLITLFSLIWICPAFADGPASDEIWTKLAGKATIVGSGLQRSGFIIGGLGLVFFSFLAIFNKISWKNLAYIMLSCFVLSGMVGLINYFSKTEDVAWNMKESTFNGPDGNTTFEGGVVPSGGTNPG